VRSSPRGATRAGGGHRGVPARVAPLGLERTEDRPVCLERGSPTGPGRGRGGKGAESSGTPRTTPLAAPVREQLARVVGPQTQQARPQPHRHENGEPRHEPLPRPLWRRVGRVFQERYHSRVLRNPRAVRAALCYVLDNARKHGAWRAHRPDPYSSGPDFEGWRGERSSKGAESRRRAGANGLLPRARTWLLGLGWRRHGRIDVLERPGSARRSGARHAWRLSGSNARRHGPATLLPRRGGAPVGP
jgi:hypothetical protein